MNGHILFNLRLCYLKNDVFPSTEYLSLLEYSDLEDLTGQLAEQDDGYYGPINVSGMGFPLAGQTHQTIYVSSLLLFMINYTLKGNI